MHAAARRAVRVLALALAPSLAAPALAEDLLVPKQFKTIQAAVDAAQPGDAVVVSKGTYRESVSISGRTNLTVRGKKGAKLLPPSGAGFDVTSSDHIAIAGFVIDRAPGDGIHADTVEAVTVDACVITRAAGAGVRIDRSSSCAVRKTRIDRSGDDAVALSSGVAQGTDNSIVSDCVFNRPGDDGVDLNGTGNSVRDNRCVRPAEDGFEVDTTFAAKGNHFERNVVVKPRAHGFVARGDTNWWLDNSVTKSGDDAFSLAGNDQTVTGNKVRGSAFDGIYMTGNLSAIAGNTITKAKDDGLDIEGNQNGIGQNKVTGSGDHGIELDGTDNQLAGNVTKKSRHGGLAAASPNTIDDTNKFDGK